MPSLCFEGTIYTGKGVGKTFVALEAGPNP